MTMEFTIDEKLFDPSYGNVRGTVVGVVNIGKRKHRLAHATLLLKGDPEVRLTLPTTTEIPVLAEILQHAAAYLTHVEAVQNRLSAGTQAAPSASRSRRGPHA